MSYRLKKLDELIQAASSIEGDGDYSVWSSRAQQFLAIAFGRDEAGAFLGLESQSSFYWGDALGARIGFLEGLAAHADMPASELPNPADPVPSAQRGHPQSKRVFVVHGHDNEVKTVVARLLEQLGLEPVILHEQPNAGLTIIEKIEVCSDVAFSVVLLTPDDVGCKADEQPKVHSRARQNVILELGYFIGVLSRRRVCALFKAGVEIPSDFSGVVYVEFDPSGGWRTKLAQELVEAGFSIQLSALLKS